MEQEKQYLTFVLSVIDKKLSFLKTNIDQSAKQIDYLLGFISDNYKDMDDEEVATQNYLLENEDVKLDLYKQEEKKLELQKSKPYFARFDFSPNGKNQPIKTYLGVNSLTKENLEVPLVVDWRAPISSMYYDFELGDAFYTSPQGKEEGKITLKRQYKIEHGKLEYMFDSSIMVMDEILQEELSKNSSHQMKNIIATIQKEQNAIIRNDNLQNIIVQGFAGSGKTSIAMHRVAYLLYRHKNLLSSNEIMIISPNKIFSYYISGVLPELGEKNILESTFLTLAKKELGNTFHFETRENMVERLLFNQEQLQQTTFKEGFEFYESLKTFLSNFAQKFFKPIELKFGKTIITKEQIEKLYFDTYKDKSPAIRLDWIADYIFDELEMPSKFSEVLTERIKKNLYKMFETSDILLIYREFLHAIGLCDISQDKICYEDIAPIMLIKDFMFGLSRNSNIKHLVIDEMQDFSPIHFELFDKLFPCNKTILGDINQSLFKQLSQEYLQKLCKQIGDCEIVNLTKVYRSTKQITEYASKMLALEAIDSVNRQGDEVEEFELDATEFKLTLLSQIYKYLQKNQKVAVICTSQELAQQVFVEIDEIDDILLVDEYTESESASVLVMSTAYSKGLEFDSVIVIAEKQKQEMQKNLLYVSCTRALHHLCVILKK